MSPSAPAAVLIAGPTASGKSALALALAEACDGLVINADALQVYADWRILTARPSQADETRAPHALYGHVDAAAPDYSVGRWLRELAPILAAARAEGRRPIIAGGTGLYLSALTEGLAPIPPIPPEIRAEGVARLEGEGTEEGERRGGGGEGEGAAALLAELDRDDPDTAARIDRRNPRRILRAWEVLRATGKGQAAWAAETPAPLISPHAARRFRLAPDRAELHARIARRFSAMLDQGALDEVRAVAARRLDPTLPAMQALGAKPLMAHLAGEADLDAAIEASVIATRQYAKRQETWFRNRFADWRPIDSQQYCEFSQEPLRLLSTEA